MSAETESPYAPGHQDKQRSNEQIAFEASLAGRDGAYTSAFHTDEKLYDHNQSSDGGLWDIVTGERVDTSTTPDAETELVDKGFTLGLLPPLEDEEDAAAKFLREQDERKKAA